MPPNVRRSAAHQRENSKQGIISVQEAGKLRTDPTYVDSDAEEDIRSHDTPRVFDCTFYSDNPSLPLYHVQAAPSTQPSSSSLENAVSSIRFEPSNVTRTPEDFVLSARDNTTRLDQGLEDARVHY